jgi:hypothetical protein
LGDSLLWAVFESYESGPHILATFFHQLSQCRNFSKKMGWAIFWAILSQTRLVTLTIVCKKPLINWPKKERIDEMSLWDLADLLLLMR